MQRALAAIARQADFFLAFGLVFATTGLTDLLASPAWVSGVNLLDDSWAYDLIVKSQQNIWLGDSVIFTYGPLFQASVAWLPRLLGGSLGAFYRSWYVFSFWAVIVFTFLTGRILLGGHSVWKRCFYLFAIVGFWMALDVRFFFDVFVFAVALWYFDRVRQIQKVPLWPTLLLPALLQAGFLISADTGMYSLAGFVIAGATHIVLFRHDHPVRSAFVRSAAFSALVLGVLMLITAVVMGRSGSNYWADLAAVITEYRWALAYPMEKIIKWRLVAVATVSLVTLALAWRWRHPSGGSLVRRPAFFPAAIMFSFLTLQSAVVRSDWGHVDIALVPGIALAGAVLMGTEAAVASWRGHLPLLLALGLTAIFSGPTPIVAPQNLARLRLRPITQTCAPDRQYFDDACLSKSDAGQLKTVSEYLRNQASPDESVAIFPYENMYADLARRRVAGGVLQNYMVLGERLLRRQLEGLRRDNPRVAIISMDGLTSWAVDGVPNFTRTPDVWFYLQNHFKRQRELAPGVLGLERDQARASRIHRESQSLFGTMQSPIRHKQPIVVPLAAWPTDSDFLRVRLKVTYSLWWKLRKPSAMNVKVIRADQSEENFRALVRPNASSDLWIYPWDDAQLANYFEASEAQWRKGLPGAPVTSLQFAFQRLDDFSVVPSRLEIQSIDAIRLRLGERDDR